MKLTKDRLDVLAARADGLRVGAPATRDEERSMAEEILELRAEVEDKAAGWRAADALASLRDIAREWLDAREAEKRAPCSVAGNEAWQRARDSEAALIRIVRRLTGGRRAA